MPGPDRISTIHELRRGLPGEGVRAGAGAGVLEEWAWGEGGVEGSAHGGGVERSAGGEGGREGGHKGGRGTGAGVLPWLAAVWRLGRGVSGRRGLVVWVGGGDRPYLLGGGGEGWSWLTVLSGEPEERVWAIERCVGCAAVSAVVADGRGMGFTATRRLQLAVESVAGVGDGVEGVGCDRVILLRDEGELGRPSAARVRGVVWPKPSGDGIVRWNAQLLRRKGMRPTDDLAEGGRVVLELRHGQVVVVCEPAEVADRSGASGSGGWGGAGARRVAGG